MFCIHGNCRPVGILDEKTKQLDSGRFYTVRVETWNNKKEAQPWDLNIFVPNQSITEFEKRMQLKSIMIEVRAGILDQSPSREPGKSGFPNVKVSYNPGDMRIIALE